MQVEKAQVGLRYSTHEGGGIGATTTSCKTKLGHGPAWKVFSACLFELDGFHE